MSTIWVDLLGTQTHYVGKKFRTRVIEAGMGEPLLMLHGIGGHAEAYSRNIGRLSERFRPIALDMVWHGFSSKPPFSDTMPAYCEQLLDVIDDLGLPKVSIEGESMGGHIAMYFALHYPDRVHKLILNTGRRRALRRGNGPDATRRRRELAAATLA